MEAEPIFLIINGKPLWIYPENEEGGEYNKSCLIDDWEEE